MVRRPLLICVALLLTMGQAARAEQVTRSVQAGVLATVYIYHSWKPDCSPGSGVVKVLTKPAHGTLSHTDDVSAPNHNRFRANDGCVGRLMKGFRLQYRSEAGYRGTDSFSVEVLFPGKPRTVDNFSVIVN
jgi:hypothetical protein